MCACARAGSRASTHAVLACAWIAARTRECPARARTLRSKGTITVATSSCHCARALRMDLFNTGTHGGSDGGSKSTEEVPTDWQAESPDLRLSYSRCLQLID
eukprot:4047689-Pleurochrysis_carterae.AAC.1